jgi:hypothetical protein
MLMPPFRYAARCWRWLALASATPRAAQDAGEQQHSRPYEQDTERGREAGLEQRLVTGVPRHGIL